MHFRPCVWLCVPCIASFPSIPVALARLIPAEYLVTYTLVAQQQFWMDVFLHAAYIFHVHQQTVSENDVNILLRLRNWEYQLKWKEIEILDSLPNMVWRPLTIVPVKRLNRNWAGEAYFIRNKVSLTFGCRRPALFSFSIKSNMNSENAFGFTFFFPILWTYAFHTNQNEFDNDRICELLFRPTENLCQLLMQHNQ